MGERRRRERLRRLVEVRSLTEHQGIRPETAGSGRIPDRDNASALLPSTPTVDPDSANEGTTVTSPNEDHVAFFVPAFVLAFVPPFVALRSLRCFVLTSVAFVFLRLLGLRRLRLLALRRPPSPRPSSSSSPPAATLVANCFQQSSCECAGSVHRN
jgi:hypothetical protein